MTETTTKPKKSKKLGTLEKKGILTLSELKHVKSIISPSESQPSASLDEKYKEKSKADEVIVKKSIKEISPSKTNEGELDEPKIEKSIKNHKKLKKLDKDVNPKGAPSVKKKDMKKVLSKSMNIAEDDPRFIKIMTQLNNIKNETKHKEGLIEIEETEKLPKSIKHIVKLKKSKKEEDLSKETQSSNSWSGEMEQILNIKEKIETTEIKKNDHVKSIEKKEIEYEEKSYTSFDDMGLSTDLLRGIYEFGFEKPSSIQQKAIVPFKIGRDLVIQSQSGTGKSGTFIIGLLQLINPEELVCQAAILSPTRELAKQTAKILELISTHMKIKVGLFTGGTSVKEDMDLINKGIHVAIGTLGRLNDLCNRNLKMITAKILVLDEADEMISKDFWAELLRFVEHFKPNVQTCLVSATISEELETLMKENKIVSNPIKFLLPIEKVSLIGIKQYYYPVERDGEKFDALVDIYKNINTAQTIIYANTRMTAYKLERELKNMKFTANVLHAGLTTAERNDIMARFRTQEIRVLIATDIIARGIDVHHVSLVVNYDIPIETNLESYIHRIGRGGRFGREGNAINIVTRIEMETLAKIEKKFSIKIGEIPPDFDGF